ncbi:RagB/SusD family nutrient uptake outer membrane protein [Myroides odoratimimus]|uniref:RagB/SusD family nutrient uptake outer membrane protein n=1 Tax=Myroides odoratimimus TaxID=76832 RepID=UPI001CE1A379|nr:RagB/SusD family nutrient uptake outer membrane protein [Myroides odoratimimus]MCA4806960.1 RagB/SusD family nutrient uptake outer membrane protein [Myroides odoratimimus]
MKKYIFTLLTLATLGCVFQSCENFLEVEPTDSVNPDNYYKTEEHIFTALIGVYNTLSDTRNGNVLYAGDFLHKLGEEGEEGYYRHTPQRNIISQFLYNPSAPSLSSFWSQLYKGINEANILLERIDQASFKNKANRDIYKGEALFLRSYFYFMLVSHFGDVPLMLKGVDTATLATTPMARTSSSVIYEQITTDMQQAFELVAPISSYNHGGRVSKSAVAGILSRVYLHWAGYPLKNTSKYENAKQWALTVMDASKVEHNHSLNNSYSQIFINYSQDLYDINESIWEVEFSGNRTDHPRQAGAVGNYNGIRSSANSPIGNANGNIRATATLFLMYKDNDIRRDWAIAPFDYNNDGTKNYRTDNETQIWGRYAGKYRREHELNSEKTSYTPINFPLLRYADILLMYAEAEYQTSGITGGAIEAINQIRKRAQTDLISSTDFSASSKDFMLFIQEERARELCFEGLRRSDLIRWNVYVETIEAMVATYENNPMVALGTKTLLMNLKNISPRHRLWPIPTRELMFNKLLTQNEGW